jgi:hypothetical protein
MGCELLQNTFNFAAFIVQLGKSQNATYKVFAAGKV